MIMSSREMGNILDSSSMCARRGMRDIKFVEVGNEQI
jgi:hypothetical protein